MAEAPYVDHYHLNATGDVVCDAEGSGDLVVVGILIGLIASVGINIGQNLQSLGMKACGQSKPHTNRTWVIGLTIFIIASIANMVAMAFASASILVPLESSQFVTNVFFSKFVNKAVVTRRQWLGTSLAVLGTVFTCVFGPNDARCFTVADMEAFWRQPAWLAYLFVTFAAATAGWAIYFPLARAMKTESPPAIGEAALPVLFALSSALLGGAQMIVHSKAIAELFDIVGGGALSFGELLATWVFWVEAMFAAACGIFWAVQMNSSLGLYDPLFIIPLLQSSYITFGATASGIFFQEFGSLAEKGLLGPATWLFYIGGIVLIIGGIMMLAPPQSLRACGACCSSASLRQMPRVPFGSKRARPGPTLMGGRLDGSSSARAAADQFSPPIVEMSSEEAARPGDAIGGDAVQVEIDDEGSPLARGGARSDLKPAQPPVAPSPLKAAAATAAAQASAAASRVSRTSISRSQAYRKTLAEDDDAALEEDDLERPK
tara:strand:- start:627 stop:2096 length:1470 start_codon:yes stop_codon:yes gene_type:complete